MVAGSCTGSGRSALASTSLPCRSLREASGEAEAGETNAQMNAIGHSNPSVANPSHPATLMAAACGCARWRASRPGNYPKKTMMTVATVMSTANTKKAIASRTSKVEATVEAPFIEIRGSNLGWCHASSVNLERPALTTDRPPTRLLAVTSVKARLFAWRQALLLAAFARLGDWNE